MEFDWAVFLSYFVGMPVRCFFIDCSLFQGRVRRKSSIHPFLFHVFRLFAIDMDLVRYLGAKF
jgi:hypothetical protein